MICSMWLQRLSIAYWPSWRCCDVVLYVRKDGIWLVLVRVMELRCGYTWQCNRCEWKTRMLTTWTRLRGNTFAGGCDPILWGSETVGLGKRKRVAVKNLASFAQDGFRPAKYFSIDRVFRNEAIDKTHLAEFH